MTNLVVFQDFQLYLPRRRFLYFDFKYILAYWVVLKTSIFSWQRERGDMPTITRNVSKIQILVDLGKIRRPKLLVICKRFSIPCGCADKNVELFQNWNVWNVLVIILYQSKVSCSTCRRPTKSKAGFLRFMPEMHGLNKHQSVFSYPLNRLHCIQEKSSRRKE